MSCGAPNGGWQGHRLDFPIPPGEGMITFQVPEPVNGFAKRLFSDPGWKGRFYKALGVKPYRFPIECVEQVATASAAGEPVSIWQMRFSTRDSWLGSQHIAEALSAALDKPNFTEIVRPTVTPTAVYIGHETENPMPRLAPNLEDILNSFENAVGQVAALALLALAIVLVSRLWPLGGMALLAALLILVLTDEGGATHAQA